uniref:Uncharacterized protein n=1 Tax=Noctiluca scintillans TaxID=2966 RepID=A0A7S1AEX0_NOCSC
MRRRLGAPAIPRLGRTGASREHTARRETATDLNTADVCATQPSPMLQQAAALVRQQLASDAEMLELLDLRRNSLSPEHAHTTLELLELLEQRHSSVTSIQEAAAKRLGKSLNRSQKSSGAYGVQYGLRSVPRGVSRDIRHIPSNVNGIFGTGATSTPPSLPRTEQMSAGGVGGDKESGAEWCPAVANEEVMGDSWIQWMACLGEELKEQRCGEVPALIVSPVHGSQKPIALCDVHEVPSKT